MFERLIDPFVKLGNFGKYWMIIYFRGHRLDGDVSRQLNSVLWLQQLGIVNCLVRNLSLGELFLVSPALNCLMEANTRLRQFPSA